MTQYSFDATQVEPRAEITPIPDGWYRAQIVESEERATRDGNGSYLAFTFEVIEGEYANRKVFERLNVRNANQTAVQIAHETLSGICRAIGVYQMQDTQDLHNRPMEIKVRTRAGRDGYDPDNEIREYRAIGAGLAQTPAGATQVAPPGAAVPPTAPAVPAQPVAPAVPQVAAPAVPTGVPPAAPITAPQVAPAPAAPATGTTPPPQGAVIAPNTEVPSWSQPAGQVPATAPAQPVNAVPANPNPAAPTDPYAPPKDDIPF